MSLDPARVRSVFLEVVDLAPSSRSDRLATLCGDDVALRAEVESLLRFDRPDPSAASGDGETPSRHRVGDSIGPYRLERLLGVGGFGEVWAASQVSPIRRQVAVKIVPPHRTRGVRDEERQLLARLRHPGIARLLEVGTLEDGAAWSAMDLVDGRPMLEAIADLPDLVSRVAVLRQACEAVASAHRVGVVHLDLKSSNVLVGRDESGRPRATVIDFGIGRLLGGETADDAGASRTPIAGTPGAMAPEQARGDEDLDTRVDVWALGRLLGRVVDGAVPPSRRAVRELGWIVDRAIAVDREDRFGTVDAFAAELARWARGEPLLDCGPDTAWRRIDTAWRRYRVPITTTIVVLVGLVATLTVVRSAQLEAEDARRRTARTLEFVRTLFDEVDHASFGPTLRSGLGPALRAALAEVEVGAAGDPLLEAELRLEAAQFAFHSGDADLMAAMIEEALDLQTSVLAADDPRLDSTRYRLAAARYNQGRFDEAETLLRPLVADLPMPPDVIDRGGGAPDGFGRLLLLASVIEVRPDGIDEAIGLLEPWIPVVPPETPDGGSLRKTLGSALLRAGRPAEAIPWLEASVAELRRRLPDDHTAVHWRRLALGAALLESGRLDEARGTLETAAAGLLENLGPTHLLVSASLERLGDLRFADGEVVKARARWATALAGMRDRRSADHPAIRRLEEKIRRSRIERGTGGS